MAMCALLLSFLFVASAGAQCTCGSNSAYSFCWTGATSTAWTTASNWDTTGAGCTYPGASGSTTEMVLILTSAASTLPTLSTALASARFAVLNITNTNPSAAMTVTVSSAFPALGTLYIGPGSVLAVQTLLVDTLIGPMSGTISATISPYNSNLPSSVNITTSWATGPYVNNAPLTLLHTNLYVDCPGRTCSGNAYLGVAANNVYFTPGSNVALAGWLVFKNGGLKMNIMAGSTVTAIGSPGGTQWVINTASCLYVDGALTLRHGINTDSFQTCIMITGTVKLDYNATASNGNSAQLLQSAYIYFAPTASVQRLASTALLVLRPNAGNATVSSGAAIDVSEIYCQNSNAPLAACIFQAGSTLTASSVNIWSNTRFELQGDTIMPATKATQLSIDSGIAKMRTHAFTTLFCSRCTLVGGTFTFDRAQISSSAYFNSTSVTIQGPSVTGENSIYAQLVLSGGSSYLLNGPLKMYSGNITDDGTGTFTSFGPGVVSFEQTTPGEAGIAVNNLTFGGSTVITTKQTLTTLNLIANSPVVLKDTTLLSPGSTSLTINAPSGLSLQNQAGVTLQGALTINGPFSMQAGGVVTLNVASASPSPLQLQGSTVALDGTARLNFTTYVPSAPSNFTVATFTAAHTGTWSAAVASPYAAWPATAYDSTAAYMIGVTPPPPPPTTTPPTPPPTTTGSPASATTAPPATTATPATTGSPATAGTTTTTGTASPTTSATTSGAATTSATSATPSSGSTSRGGGGGLAPGAIAGIAIGGVVLLAVAGALVYLLWWRPHQATRQHFYE